jgi:hypothetical protein
VLGAVVVIGPLLWMAARSRHGLPARTRILRQARAKRGHVTVHTPEGASAPTSTGSSPAASPS